MTPEQALNVLDEATQPGVQLSRQSYVVMEQAFRVLREAITPAPEPEVKTEAKAESAPKRTPRKTAAKAK